jgi:hypothetical protein
MRCRELLKSHRVVIPERHEHRRRAAVCHFTAFGRAWRSVWLHEDETLRHEEDGARINAGLEPSAMTDIFRLLASDFRARAEDIFARAERVRDADIREKMRGIAVGYEKMAQRVEQHARDVDAAYRGVYAARCRRRAVSPIPRSLGTWRHFRRFVQLRATSPGSDA